LCILPSVRHHLVVTVVWQFNVTDARRRELEGPDGRAAVQVFRSDGQQVLKRVALDAKRLSPAVGHLKTCKIYGFKKIKGFKSNIVLNYIHGCPGVLHRSMATLCGSSSVCTMTCHLPVESLA
jgi:hypothetical protein